MEIRNRQLFLIRLQLVIYSNPRCNYFIPPYPLSLSLSLPVSPSAPCIPANVHAGVECASNTVVASWDVTPGALSYTGTLVGSEGFSASCTPDSNGCSFPNTDCAQDYSFSVVAHNQLCSSDASESAAVRTGKPGHICFCSFPPKLPCIYYIFFNPMILQPIFFTRCQLPNVILGSALPLPTWGGSGLASCFLQCMRSPSCLLFT